MRLLLGAIVLGLGITGCSLQPISSSQGNTGFDTPGAADLAEAIAKGEANPEFCYYVSLLSTMGPAEAKKMGYSEGDRSTLRALAQYRVQHDCAGLTGLS